MKTLLSPKSLVSFSIVSTPNIQRFYFRAFNISIDCFIATNFEPKLELSTVFFRFDYQMIGALFKNIRILVVDIWVIWSTPLSPTKKHDIWTSRPLASFYLWVNTSLRKDIVL